MAEKLSILCNLTSVSAEDTGKKTEKKAGEKGFVLVTSLVLLSLLTLLAVGVMYSGNISQQTSASARDSTEAFYYAETGIHYMAWALNNDAEFDGSSTVVKLTGGFPPLLQPSNAASVGDRTELFYDLSNPGPTATSDTSSAGTKGQLMYFDNTPLGNRAVCWPANSSCDPNASSPVFSGINVKLPRYIMLEIGMDGNIPPKPIITPTIPALLTTTGPPYHGTVVGTDVPNNGVIVWITAGNASEDAEIPSLDACTANPAPASGQSCYLRATAGTTQTAKSTYGIVAYAIGYVNGKARRMLRAVIM